ncbi:DUF5677 domain-containing protein [Nitrospira sp. BLG_2]|uniref:DUF5677 domain-containing protein n=1 Tax=Nitrospira sp. BLG_2 TaxID=3397507 RepID=UPI003B9BEA56
MTESITPVPEEPEVLHQTIDTFRVYSGIVLLSFAKHGQELRNTVARNFIARGMSCTQSIYAVWKTGSEQDAWILHRSLLDRLFHLHHLAETEGFTGFEEHSFLAMYEARHQLLSDPDMSRKAPRSLNEIQEKDRSRYEAISRKQPRWRRPKPEDVAKKMNLGFLYRLGYDYASTHVHPMAGDGEKDFTTLISPPGAAKLTDATVIKNSILVQSMLVQEALNISSMRWRAIVYEFLSQIRIFLETGDPRFQETLYKIGQAWQSFELCEPLAPIDRS